MIRQAFLLRAGRAVGLSTASGAASASNPASSGAAQTARAGLLSVGLRGVANSPLLAVPDARTGGHMVEHSSEKLTEAKVKQLKGESEVVVPETEGWSHTLASMSEAVIKAEKAPELPVEQLQRFSVEVIQKVHSDSKKEEKTGVDVSSMPSMKENIDKTVNDPTARGHAE